MNYSVRVTSGIISILFILLTAWVSFSHTHSVLFDFAFIFHVIPYGIGFTGEDPVWTWVYYFFLWLGLSFVFSLIVEAYRSSKRKKIFLIVSIAPLILAAIIVIYIDYSNNSAREERIAERVSREKIEFSHLRTGDLLFNQLGGVSSTAIEDNSHTLYDNIGIVFITEDNYTVMEATDRVGYTSVSRWIEKGLDRQYVVKRLVNADSLLTEDRTQELRNEAHSNIWQEVEKLPDWADDKVYNAELIWKIYKRSLNVELGELDTMKVNSNAEYVITPHAIFTSTNLVTVGKD